MIIIHGENTIQSRNKLVELIEQAKVNQVIVEKITAKELTLASLESKLQKTDLFGHSRLLVIEELHSLTKSKNQTSLIKLLEQTQMDICLWEKRQLTPTMLKQFPDAKVFEYKLANSLFAWLDSLSSEKNSKTTQLKLFKTAVAENDEYLCLVMLARQIRLLIQAREGNEIKGPSFIANKIRSQANKFSITTLLKIHQQLYKFDKLEKTSAGSLNLSQQIEQLIINL